MYLGASGESELSDDAIRHLINAAKRYHYASLQDKNPVISGRHNAYAVAIIHQVSSLASGDRIKAASGQDIRALRWEIVAAQDAQEQLVFKVLEKLKAKGIDISKVINGDVDKLLDHVR